MTAVSKAKARPAAYVGERKRRPLTWQHIGQLAVLIFVLLLP